MAEKPASTFTLAPYSFKQVEALMDALGLAEPVAVTLARRGYGEVEDARAFLDAAEDHDPSEFAQMEAVVEQIREAVAGGRRITVHGDYDVDGVCSTAILIRALRRLGGDPDWVIPSRTEDGYGLTEATVDALAARGTELLVTVDCGIGSRAEVAKAKRTGIAVIVTDHHHPPEALPDCPILHPAIAGYPCPDLCATGVAFKLALALTGAVAEDELDLVALATVADLVPLRGENRALVRRGLAVAREARRPGMRALIEVASVLPERLDEGDLAFRLGPRINAAGRLYRADAGVELMLTADPERARAIAEELERANRERREVELELLRSAEQAVAKLPAELADAPGLVLAGRGWHPGVVGIVASRLAEQLWKPVVLVSLDEHGSGRGSGRSIPGFDLLAALDACAEHLGRYGGHRAAAGVEMSAEQLPGFQRTFAEAVAAAIPPEATVRTERVDAIVGGESLDFKVAEQFGRLGPFGLGNPGVRLLVPGARLSDVRPMGEGDRHARFSLASGPRRALGVAFNVNGALAKAAAGGPVDVSVKLELNEWNGAVEPRVVLGHLYDAAEVGPEAGTESAEPEGAAEDAEHPSSGDPRGGGLKLAKEIADDEFWRRFDAECSASLAEWPPLSTAAAARRRTVERRGASAVATVAALASSGASLLVVCADSLRRRALVERAVRPARFGGGALALVSGRFPAASLDAALALRSVGRGTVLADWAAIARQPSLVDGFEHVVVVDPAPFSHLERAAERGEGYLHRTHSPAEVEFALRCHSDEWPSRSSLALLYRSLASACDESGWLAGARTRELLCGEGRAHPHSPEVAARAGRVLAELGLLSWERFAEGRRLRVVNSKRAEAERPAGNPPTPKTELELSEGFRTYRARFEEGRRYLSEQRQN